MASWSASSFSTSAFSPSAFDFGGITPPTPTPDGSVTPGFIRSLKGMRAFFRGETDEEKETRRAQMFPIAPPAPIAPKRVGPPTRAKWKKR